MLGAMAGSLLAQSRLERALMTACTGFAGCRKLSVLPHAHHDQRDRHAVRLPERLDVSHDLLGEAQLELRRA